MTKLVDLPDELLLLIYDRVYPGDLINFAVTCKHIHTLGKDRIQEHPGMMAEFHAIHFRDFNDSLPAWNLLFEILNNPWVSYYVRTIDTTDRKTEWKTPTYDNTWYQKALEQAQKFDLEDLIVCGNDGAVITHLLPMLEQLRKLTYVVSGMSNAFRKALGRIAFAYWDNAPDANAFDIPFRHLSTVVLSHWDTEGSMSYKWVLYFSRIPSVRFLSGHMVGGNYSGDENDDSRLRACKSNVKTLVFTYSCIGHGALDLIISSMSDLQHFDYEYGGSVVDDEDWDPKAILNVLLRYTSNSLQTMELCDIHDSEMVSGNSRVSLRDFKCLKSLSTASCYLLEDPDDDIDDSVLSQGFYNQDCFTAQPAIDLADLLPASLEKLHLQYWNTDDADLRKVALSLLEAKKQEKLPILRKIELSPPAGPYNGSEEERARIMDIAANMSIKLKF